MFTLRSRTAALALVWLFAPAAAAQNPGAGLEVGRQMLMEDNPGELWSFYAALTADIIVINRGSAPARDVLVEAQLINAGPQVDADVGRFFMQPAGTGERVAVIPPMGSVAITLRLQAPGAKLAPLVVEGRKLLVPMVAINAFYRWSGGEMSDSSSFLVGRGDAEGGKMAPFRLDQGARGWSGLGARLHSSGLQR